MIIYAFTHLANTWSDKGIHLSPEALQAHKRQGAVVVESGPHDQHLKALLWKSGLTEQDLVKR